MTPQAGGLFNDDPYVQATLHDFDPGGRFAWQTVHNGRTVVIGDIANDPHLGSVPNWLSPGTGVCDVVIHGLPGRFLERCGGRIEIPLDVVVALLTRAGLATGEPLRLVCCHAGERPESGRSVAEALASVWGGSVSAPNGILHVLWTGAYQIDLVDWEDDPVYNTRSAPRVRGRATGCFLDFPP